MSKLLIATRSKGKFPEIAALLEDLPLEVISLNDIPELEGVEVEESAQTFEGNALIKAFLYGKKAEIPVLSEDSGLEVEVLGGRPGVLSARYASGTDADRNEKLLTELSGVPEDNRTARYRAVAAFYDPETDLIRTAEGECSGKILTEPRGENGFGYDPIFFMNELGKTGAEATPDEKNSVSHRAKAFVKMRQILQKELN